MRNLSCWILPFAITICVLLVSGCGGGDDSPNVTRVQKMIGPEGGTIEITDPESSVYRVKISIPEGALAQATTIFVESTMYSPILADGLRSRYPMYVKFGPEIDFLKDVEITLPVRYNPSGEYEILGSFFWDTQKAEWIVVPAKHIADGTMIIETPRSGLCQWGSIYLDKLESDTAIGMMHDMKHMYDFWNELRSAVEDELQDLISLVEDPNNVNSCAAQDAVVYTLSLIREKALQDLTAFLSSETILNQCKICDRNQACRESTCDPTLLISGEPIGWLHKEWQIWFESVFFSAFCPSDILAPVVEKMVALALYQEAIREMNCDWRCILRNGNNEFYINLLLGNATSFSIFGIESYRYYVPCN